MARGAFGAENSEPAGKAFQSPHSPLSPHRSCSLPSASGNGAACHASDNYL